MVISRRQSLRTRAERRFHQAADAAQGTPGTIVSARRAVDAWLSQHERLVAFLLPPLLFGYCIALGGDLVCCADSNEARSTLQMTTSVAIGVAALVVPLLVLAVESAGRRGLDAPTEMLWRLTGLRGVILFVYGTLFLELAGYVLVHRMVAWQSGVATGGLLVLAVTLVRLAVATNGVISHSQPGIIKQKWLDVVREQVKALAKEDVIRRLGTSILSEELTPNGIDIDQRPGSALVLGEDQMTTVTITPEAPFRYIDDIDLAVVKNCAERLMPGADRAFSRVTFGLTLGEAAIITDGVTMVHREDATVAAERIRSELLSALRLGPSRAEPLQQNIDYLATSALAALARSDSAHAATLIDDFSSVVLASAAAFNALPADLQRLPRRRNERVQLSEWTAGLLESLLANVAVGGLPSTAVDDALLAVWRRAWSLAVAAHDPLGGVFLAQVTPAFERLIRGLTPIDRQRRFREWVAGGPWGPLGWYDASADGEGRREIAVQRFEDFAAVAVTAMVNHLRQTIRQADSEAFKQVVDANQHDELERRGELEMRDRMQQGFVAGQPAPTGGRLVTASANLHDRFRIGVGKAVSWVFKLQLSGRVPTTFAQPILAQSQSILTPDVEHLIGVLRHEMGDLILPGERDTDWMWELPSGVYSIPATLGQPLWAFVLAYLRTPPAPMLLPELKGPVIDSDPERLFAEILQQADERAADVATCLTDGLTADVVRERVTGLRQETLRWKQQLRTMRFTQIATQPLDASLIREAKKRTEEAFDRHRVLGQILKQGGRETSRLASLVRTYAIDDLHAREDFIAGGDGATRLAERLGKLIAHFESSVIGLAEIEAKKEDVRKADWHGFDAAVGEAVAALRISGFDPSAILIGDQSARTAIKLQPRIRSDPDDQYVLGRKDDVLVVVAADLPDGAAVVSDLIQAGHLTLHLLAEDAHPVRSTIADLSREQIEDLLAKYPSLHLDGGGQKLTPPEARLQLRSKVRWFARLHTAFEVDQPEAIRVIQMDPVPTDEQVIDYLNEGQG